jgi:hypothetical protein
MNVVDTSKYSSTFVDLLALALAVKICMPISQDKNLAGVLDQRYMQEQRDVWESDANIGNEYKKYDDKADNDTFVNPDGYVESTDSWRTS